MNNPGYYRRASGARRTREREEGDAVAVALTLQVILAVILVLTAVIAKKTDAAKFGELRTQYTIMATAPAEREKVRGLFSGDGWRSLFTGIEEAVTSALARLSGTAPTPEQTESPAAGQTEKTAPEPEMEVVTEPTVESETVPAFSYSNLTEPVATLGRIGEIGIRPETLLYKARDEEPVPEDCTLAPVILRGRLQPPVTGVITSGFAYREHPITGRSDFHNGMDIAADAGSDVLAAMPGEVAETGWSEIYGNYLILLHDDNFKTFYGHCSKLLLSEGDKARQGEPIAKVGDTGVTTGPHLHFSVIVSSYFADPYWVLRDSIRQVQPA